MAGPRRPTRSVRVGAAHDQGAPGTPAARAGSDRIGPRRGADPSARRSEEHTSELQSRPHLVCRLLLEKKKDNSKMLKVNGISEPGIGEECRQCQRDGDADT